MTEVENYMINIDKLLEFRNILQKLQLHLEIHLCKCPVNKQDALIKVVNQYIDSANGLLETEINKTAYKIDNTNTNTEE